jgi:crescentin
MRTVSNLLWPAGAKSPAQPAAGPVPLQRNEEPPAKSESAAPVGARPVDDHEVLRRLLAETGNQLGAIDNLKDSFSKLVLPLHNLLITLESEKASQARSQDAFEEIRTGQETLRTELQGLERKSLELERDNDRLRRELEAMRHDTQEPDNSAKLANEVEAQRIAMNVIVKRLGEESGNSRALSEENAALVKRLEQSETRLADMEAQLKGTRERLATIESSSAPLQAALEKAQSEAAHNARRLGETEGLLADARKKVHDTENSLAVAEAERNTAIAESERLLRQIAEIQAEVQEARTESTARLQQLESSLAEAEAQRDGARAESGRLFRQMAEFQQARTESNTRVQELESRLAEAEAEKAKLAAARDEAEERRQKESHTLRLEIHELRQRSGATEQLLAEAQQSAANRAADSAGAEARLLEETVARAAAEKKLSELVAAGEGSRQQIQQLECEVVNLTDRCKALSETLAGGEASRTEAHDKIMALTSQIEQLQAESTKYRARAEQVFAQLNATVEHERRERAHMEGALERARNDYARLQRAVVEERSVRRSDHQRRLAGGGGPLAN